MIGQTISRYRIVEKIGAGGMGEVYRARDERLDREVAIKVLPEAFADDPGRLARFEREAKLLAALNHTNIATLYGLEEHEGQRFLVMELVGGEDLTARIRRGPIAEDEALPVALQIAEGLEAAHEQGITHRDLKPANLVLTPEGKVKILDFGIARSWQREEADGDLTQSPTVTAQMTEAGVLLGTAAYMSPEQARGKRADKRADIWAFGCCLYEMLTGERAFQGETVTDVLAAVVRSEPDWRHLPVSTPRAVRRLLRRCLHKDPAQRLHDIADARLELLEARAGSPEAPEFTGEAAPRRPALRAALLLLLGIILGGVAGWVLTSRPAPTEPVVTRFTLTLPEGQRLSGSSQAIAISPDARTVAYVAESGGQRQLYIREMSTLAVRPLSGTEDAIKPFFSPDGRWVGFYADSKLKKAHVAGGRVVEVCDVPPWLSGSWDAGSVWSAEGQIIFAWGGDVAGVSWMKKVSEAGGEPADVFSIEDHAVPLWPHILPRNRGLLFTVSEERESELVVQSLESNQRWTVLRGGQGPLQAGYLPSGHLVYAEAGRLLAAPFDLDRYEVGTPVPVLEGVRTGWAPGLGAITAFALSESGALVYIPGSVDRRELVWVDREGRATPLDVDPAGFSCLRLSPDGASAAIQVMTPEGSNVWLYDLDRGTVNRLTSPGNNLEPIWTPDSRWITFSSFGSLYWTRADGSGKIEQLMAPDHRYGGFPSSWSPDGRVLAFYCLHPSTQRDIHLMALDDEWVQRPILVTESNEHSPMFSPDGAWLAYVSDRSGREEIYVQPYPGPGPRHQVSSQGGREPMWSRDGRELFYRSEDKLMSVGVETGPSFSAAMPRVLFEGRYEIGVGGGQLFDVSPDGQRFLMIRQVEEQELTEIRVVLNWAEELKRLVPPE